jgi:hypothetical protein
VLERPAERSVHQGGDLIDRLTETSIFTTGDQRSVILVDPGNGRRKETESKSADLLACTENCPDCGNGGQQPDCNESSSYSLPLLCGEPVGEKERHSSAEHGAGANGEREFWEAKVGFFHDDRFGVFLKSSNGGMVGFFLNGRRRKRTRV